MKRILFGNPDVDNTIASSRLEGHEPTPDEIKTLLAIANGEVTADEAVAEIMEKYKP